MKRITLLFIILGYAAPNVYSQCKDCHQGMRDPSAYAQLKANHPEAKSLPPDSSNGLAQSYILQNVCGLNWEQSSVLVETRSKTYGFNTNGTGLPATVPLTFSSCSVDSVVKAFLYFNGSYQTSYAANPASVTITNPASAVFNYMADSIGTAGTKCWSEVGTIAYRVDVTTCISGGGNYIIDLTGTGITDWSVDGISLVVIYVDKSAAYSGSIVLYDGLYTSMGGNHSETFTGFNVCNATPTAQAFSILADMQSNACSGVNTETYNGSTSTFPNLFYNFCTVTTPLTSAQTSTTYTVYTNNIGCDCYSWVLAGLYWQNTNCMTCTPSVIPTLTLSVVPPRDTICQGDSVQLTASGGTSYVWGPATGLSCTACPNPKASPNATTTYTVTGFIGCTIGVDTVTVVVEPKGTLSVTPTSAQVCPGSPVSLLASGGTNYLWKPANTLSCSTCANPTATPITTTTYTVISGFNGCEDSLMVTITIGAPVPSVTPSNPSICYGSSTTLTASGDSAYIWKPAASLSCSNCITTVASPTATTTYTIIGIAKGGCADSTTDVVTVIPTPSVTVVPLNPTICKGGSVVLNASGATNYTWTPATGLTCTSCSSPTATPTATTTYTIVGGTSGCKDTITETVNVLNAPVPIITAKPDSVCQGDTVLLIGSGGGTYKWNSTYTNDSIKVAPTSTKVYTLTVSNGACADSTTVTIHITPKITAALAIMDSVICPFDTAFLTVTSAGGPSTYKWSNSSTASAIKVAPGTTTSYTVTAYGKCDTISLVKTVTVVPLPSPVITGSSRKCRGIKDTLKVSGGTTYKWSNGSTKTTYYTGNINADSSFYVVAYNSLGCPDTTRFNITIQPVTTGTVTYSGGCASAPIVVTAAGIGTGPFIYSWKPGGQTTDTIDVNITTATIYTVTISDGCPITKTIRVVPIAPNLSACCDATISIGSDTLITASGTGIKSYSWQPGVSCINPPICDSVKVTPTVTTTYTVTATDSLGCETDRIVTIIVETPCFNFVVPNVFTPNNPGPNGVNFEFYIKTENITGWSIYIYDRWGKEMFKSTNPNVYWTGDTEGGAKAPDGIYYYILSGTCQSNTYKKEGFIQLIR